jgi:hypothetical protein
MSATSLDLSQIKTDALSAASTFRTLIGLGTGNTPTFLGASLTGGTVTASTPLINATQTWNSAATVFTGILANVTDTASNASSLLMDLQVGGSSRFSVDKNGSVAIPQTQIIRFGGAVSGASVFQGFNSSLYIGGPTNATTWIAFDASGSFVRSNAAFRWSTSATDPYATQLALFSDAADTLAQRRSTNAQTFRIYESFTDASNYTRGKLEWSSNVLRIGTEKAGTGSARALELQTDGTTRLTIASTGVATFSGDMSANDIVARSSWVGFGVSGANGWIKGQSSGVIGLYDNPTTSFGRLQFGGTTSSFPAIKRNAAALNFRLADDSADADITAAALTLSGNLTISTKNIVTDTTTGTKIGTATTQKLAFWNATPVVQPTAVADAIDAASVITQLNALLSRMRDLGLIAT